MTRLFLPLLGVSLFAFTACSDPQGNGNDTAGKSEMTGDTAKTTMPASTEGTTQPGNMGSAPTMGKADPNGPTAPHATDAEFMMSAAHSDQNEIQFSKMALAKGVTGDVKMLADKMIADHTKSSAELKPIADKAGVKLPTDMDAAHKTMAPALEKLSGKDFEAKYIQQMVADHQMTANTLASHKQMTKNAQLTGWINNTLPVVESHLAMASKDGGMKM